MERLGEVVKYDKSRSFGFIREIKEHGCEQFFHISGVIDRIVLNVGDIVIYEVLPNPKRAGTTIAANIRLTKTVTAEDAGVSL